MQTQMFEIAEKSFVNKIVSFVYGILTYIWLYYRIFNNSNTIIKRMKVALIFLLLIFSFLCSSQTAPQKINYQVAVRTAAGTPIGNQAIGVQFRILQGSATGSAVYSETQTPITNALGLFSTQIGGGSNFNNINWSAGSFFLEVSLDIAGGTSYTLLSSPQQLVSVPYALYAGSAPSPTVSFNSVNSILTIGSNTVMLPVSTTGTPSTTIVNSGVITTTLVGNTYTINSPAINVSAVLNPTLSSTALGLAQVIGTSPNYSVMVAPVIAYDPTVGVLSLSSIPLSSPPYSYNYNITPKIILNSNILTIGPSSNSVALPGAPVATPNTSVGINSAGIGSVNATGTNSFNINIPATNITGTGVLGSFPNYTLTGVSQTSITSSGTGGAVVTPFGVGTNSFNIAVPAVTITATGALTQAGAFPSLAFNSPSVIVSANPTLGLAQVSGPFPNWQITVNPSISYMNSTGSLVLSNPGNPGALSYSYSVLPQLNYSNNVLWSGPTSNSVSVPTTSIAQAGGAMVLGAYPSFTVSAPQQVNITTAGATTVNAVYPNINIGTPSVIVLPYNGFLAPGTNGGLLSFFGAYPNYSISVIPQIGYSSTTGSLVLTNPTTLNSFSYNITPAATVTNNIIQSGPPTNTVAVITPSAQVFNVAAGALAILPLPQQLSSTLAFTKLSVSSEIEIYVHTLVYPGVFASATEVFFEIRVDGLISSVSVPHYLFTSAQTQYITLKAVFSGLAIGAHTASIWSKVDAGTSTGCVIDPNNKGGKMILKETY